ncbi:unnamed protein product, partial [Laminaria digitata]
GRRPDYFGFRLRPSRQGWNARRVHMASFRGDCSLVGARSFFCCRGESGGPLGLRRSQGGSSVRMDI